MYCYNTWLTTLPLRQSFRTSALFQAEQSVFPAPPIRPPLDNSTTSVVNTNGKRPLQEPDQPRKSRATKPRKPRKTTARPSASIDGQLEVPEGICVLTHEVLNVNDIIASVGSHEAGATAVFIGTTRNSFKGDTNQPPLTSTLYNPLY